MKETIFECDKTKQIYKLFVLKLKLLVAVAVVMSKSISRLELAPAPLLGWSHHQHVALNISFSKIFEAQKNSCIDQLLHNATNRPNCKPPFHPKLMILWMHKVKILLFSFQLESFTWEIFLHSNRILFHLNPTFVQTASKTSNTFQKHA